MSAKVTVRRLTETEYPAWTALVNGSPDGSIYATPEYLDVLCRAAGGRFGILGAFRGDEPAGGLPLYETDTGAGRVVSPRLLLYYLGPVLRRFPTKYPSQETSRSVETLGGLAEALAAEGYDRVTLKGRHTVQDIRPFLVRGWTVRPSHSYVVPLADLAAQKGRVEQNLRRLIDRCGTQGIQLTEDDDFATFLRLHKLTMEHHDTAAYLPDTAFRQWFETLHRDGRCRLFHARLPDGTSVAAQLVLLGDHPVSHTVSAGTDPAHRQLGAAAFLRWRVFEWLANAGKQGNDLTDAALNPVTHFKSQLGGELVTNFVLESPGSFRWRTVTGLTKGYWTLRGAAGSAVRRLRGRGSP